MRNFSDDCLQAEAIPERVKDFGRFRRAHAIASKLDDDSLDHQLVTLKYELNAASSEHFATDLIQRAKLLEASRCEVEPDT